MHPDDRVWYATTQSKDGLTTDSQDIQTANHVTRRCDPTTPTAVRALSLVPQHPRFASLQPLPPSGTLRFVTLRLLQSPQMFVAGLDNGLRRATTDQESFLTIGGGNEGIDAQVNAKHGLLACVFLPMAVQLARTLHRFAKFSDDLLDTLRAEPWIVPFGPLLPALFAGPLQMTPSYAVMALPKIPPQTGGFSACRRERAPFGGGV